MPVWASDSMVERMRWNTGTKLFLVAFLALGLRIIYICQSVENPFFDAPMVDAGVYVDDALKMADGAWEGSSQPFWQPPLYPYFLAVLFALCGEGYYLPRFVQAAVGTATCVLLFFLGRRTFSPSTGWMAAGMAALYGPFIYFEGELLPVGLALCFDVLLLLNLLWAAGGKSSGRWLLGGILLGVSGLTVANVFLFAPVVLLWTFCFLPPTSVQSDSTKARSCLRQQMLRHPRLFPMVAFFLGMALVVAPVTLRNRTVGGEWVLVSYNAGVNFFVGNNPHYDETVNTRPGRAWVELVNTPEREAGITSRVGNSRFFFSKSWEFISGDPVGYLKLILRKLYLFWRGDEIQRNLDPYYARTYSSMLGILLWKHGLAFPFGIVAPLSLLGLGYFLTSPSRQTPAGSLVVLFTATYVLSVVLFFVAGRYRLPVVPCLLLFATYGVINLLQQRGKPLVISAAILLLLLIGTNTGTGRMDTKGDAYQHYWMGVAFEGKGMKANALREYRHAVKLDSSHEEALIGLATMYAKRRRYDEAVEAGQRLLRYYPDRVDVRFRLADLFLLKGDYQPAIDLYQDLIPHWPDWAALHGRLAYAYLMADVPDKAEAAYRRTLALNPDSLLVRYQLAQVYEVRGKDELAMQEYHKLLEQQPDHVDALCHLADLLLRHGKAGKAEELLEEALSVDPRSVDALRGMAELETRRGRYEEAITHLLAAVAIDPDNFMAHGELGRAYLETGQKDQAQAEFEIYERGTRLDRMRRIAEEETRKMAESILGEKGP